jgi:hypothetical protein
VTRSSVELVLDCPEPQRLEAFWVAALRYRSLFSAEEIVVLVDHDGVGPPLILQQVPEPKRGKRMHLDVIAEDGEGEVARLEALGARRLHDGVRSLGPTQWVTMADLQDNEFCVSTGVEW